MFTKAFLKRMSKSYQDMKALPISYIKEVHDLFTYLLVLQNILHIMLLSPNKMKFQILNLCTIFSYDIEKYVFFAIAFFLKKIC